MATEKPTLGRVLLKLRVELGDISQKELGALLGGLDDSTISLWEAGKVKRYPKRQFRYLDLKKMNYYVSEGYRQCRFSTPKRGKKRFVDLPLFLAEELACYVKDLKKKILRRGQGGEIDLLFHDPQEEDYWPYSQRKVQMLVKRVCKGAQLRLRNPHDLRHTYASILLMANRSPA